MKVGEVKTIVPFEFDAEERNVLKRAEEIVREMIDLLNTGGLDHFEEEDEDNEWDEYELLDLADHLHSLKDVDLANADA